MSGDPGDETRRGREQHAAPAAGGKEDERRDVQNRGENDRVPAPARQNEAPPHASESKPREGAASARQERTAEQHGSAHRDRPGERGRQPHAEDRRARELQANPVDLQVEHPDASERLRDAVGRGPDRISKIAPAPLERHRRLDERDVVDPQRDWKRVEPREPEERPSGERGDGEENDRRGPERQRAREFGAEAAAAPEKEEGRRERAGRRGRREEPDPEKQPRDEPAGVRVEEQRGPDRLEERHPGDEGRRAADENCCCFPGVPGTAHFWKKRNRFTEDGPSEKKSPERSGRAQSSSDTPARSSGFGTGSPFRYVPQVERMSTSR